MEIDGAAFTIANLRKDTLQKTTTAIVTKATSNGQRACCMVIEDLNISGMLKNRRLSRAIADVGLYEFRRQLTYKLEAARRLPQGSYKCAR